MDVFTVLAQTELFAELSEAELAELVDLADDCRLVNGAQLYSEGDPPDYSYVVAHGRLRAVRVSDCP